MLATSPKNSEFNFPETKIKVAMESGMQSKKRMPGNLFFINKILCLQYNKKDPQLVLRAFSSEYSLMKSQSH